MKFKDEPLHSFVAYLEQKGLSKASQRAYCFSIEKFLTWYDGEILSCLKKDILAYLTYLKEKRGQSNTTRQCNLYALQHYFDFLVRTGNVAVHPTASLKIRGSKTQKLQHTYTPQELDQLYDEYHQIFIKNFDDSHIPKNQRQLSSLSRQRNYIMLGLLIYQGIVPRELNKLCIEDIDMAKAKVFIHGRTSATDRRLSLEAGQIGALVHYLQNVRPWFLDYCTETERVFFALPPSGKLSTTSSNLTDATRHLSSQLKSIVPSFQNLRQLRASRIVQWLKTEGLRRTQYLAGHKSIVSTEEYLPNDLEQLSEDMVHFNPFVLC